MANRINSNSTPDPQALKDTLGWMEGPDCDDLTAAVMVLCTLIAGLMRRVSDLESRLNERS